MAFVSLKDFFARLGLVSSEEFNEYTKAWRVAVDSGSQESLLAFICRERGIAEDVFLQKLGQALRLPFLDLPRLDVPTQARGKISTKVAFQHSIMPTDVIDGSVQVVVSNP